MIGAKIKHTNAGNILTINIQNFLRLVKIYDVDIEIQRKLDNLIPGPKAKNQDGEGSEDVFDNSSIANKSLQKDRNSHTNNLAA